LQAAIVDVVVGNDVELVGDEVVDDDVKLDVEPAVLVVVWRLVLLVELVVVVVVGGRVEVVVVDPVKVVVVSG
jgi:hypothetical protein